MDYILKTVKSAEDSDSLLQGSNKTIKNKAKEQD